MAITGLTTVNRRLSHCHISLTNVEVVKAILSSLQRLVAETTLYQHKSLVEVDHVGMLTLSMGTADFIFLLRRISRLS